MRKIMLMSGIMGLGALVACGQVQSAAEEVAERTDEAVRDVRQSLDDAIQAANDYVDQPQLDQRRRHCERARGTWASRVAVSPCEAGQATVTIDGQAETQRCGEGVGTLQIDQCVHRDGLGRAYFNDGPSTPASLQYAAGLSGSYDMGRWMEVFWDAAVNHDHCYHHNGITRSLSQRDCDVQMLQDLTALCAAPQLQEASWFTEQSCRRHAALAYLSVRSAGAAAYAAQDTEVDYPVYQPMSDKLGIAPQRIDDQIQVEADKMLDAVRSSGLL